MDRHTTKRVISKVKQYCDHCTGVIWSVVQASYICADCGYCVHHKCINSIARVCAHISASENKEPTYQICPEIGLAKQHYKCFECETSLSFSKSIIKLIVNCKKERVSPKWKPDFIFKHKIINDHDIYHI